MKQEDILAEKKIVPIFVGGTGRSGTTILAKILKQHSKLYAFPLELRFITDPDGLISIENALVKNWCFFHADMAIARFRRLMNNLEGRYFGKYPNFFLGSILGKETYRDWVNNYLSILVQFEFVNAWAGRVNFIQKVFAKYLGKRKLFKPFLPTSYFAKNLTQKEFGTYTRDFLNEFYQEIAKKEGKSMIIDHTPSSVLHAEFILKIFPEAKFINISRNKNDVAASYATKDWGHSDLEKNMLWIDTVLDKWESQKKIIPAESFLEITFEDLILKKEDTLQRICDFLYIDVESAFFDIKTDKHNIGRAEKKDE